MRGTLTGLVTAWLGLIALQAIGTQGGSGRVAQFFTDTNTVIRRVLDPTVPAIPDRRTSTASTSAATSSGSISNLSVIPRLPIAAPSTVV